MGERKKWSFDPKKPKFLSCITSCKILKACQIHLEKHQIPSLVRQNDKTLYKEMRWSILSLLECKISSIIENRIENMCRKFWYLFGWHFANILVHLHLLPIKNLNFFSEYNFSFWPDLNYVLHFVRKMKHLRDWWPPLNRYGASEILTPL